MENLERDTVYLSDKSIQVEILQNGGVIRHGEFGEGHCATQISRIQGGVPQITRYTLSVS